MPGEINFFGDFWKGGRTFELAAGILVTHLDFILKAAWLQLGELLVLNLPQNSDRYLFIIKIQATSGKLLTFPKALL